MVTVRAVRWAYAVLLSLFYSGSREEPARPTRTAEPARAAPADDPVVDLAVGGTACVRTASGKVRCVGRGRTANPIQGLDRAKSFDVGGPFGCALVEGGEVDCWATATTRAAMHESPNVYGQLGRRDRAPLYEGAKVEGLPPATSVATGAAHACAIATDGRVFCWGANQSGQLGDGTVAEAGGPVRAGTPDRPIIAGEAPPQARPRPTAVEGIAGARALALGGAHSCALLADGSVRCWGANDHGQLGDGTREHRTRPVAVAGLSGALAIRARGATTCAKKTSGEVLCWGANDHGQLGDGTREDRASPVPIPALAGAVEIALGGTHGCARIARRVVCWGDRSLGACGGGTGDDALGPTPVEGLDGAAQIAAAGGASFARVGREVRVWGTYALEDSGEHHVVARPVPVPLPPAAEVAVGQRFSCARLVDGTVRCWGIDVEGELGRANEGIVATEPSAVPGIEHAASLSTSVFGACVALVDGTVRCWGDVDPSERTPEKVAPWTPTGVAGAVEVAAGARFFQSCARLRTGRLTCFRRGERAHEVRGVENATAVAVGNEHACALCSNGSVLCWGSGYYGQLGDGTTSGQRGDARAVEGASGITALSLEHNLSVARKGDGSLVWWGESGRETQARPEPVAGIGSVQAVSGHCAWLASGALACGAPHEAYAPAPAAEWTLALPADALSGARRIAVTAGHACAIFGESEVRCWGENGNGEVLPGADVHRAPTPIEALR